MRVFNITDASTAALRNQGLENQHIRVGETVIPPGGSVTLRGTSKERSELQVYIKVGAVALEELPVAYAAKRGLNLDGTTLPTPQPNPTPAPAPVEALRGMDVTPELFVEEAPRKKGR